MKVSKNIHVLPTDKPSKMWFNLKGKLVLDTVNCLYEDIQCQNIYITSDEEIKEGDFYLHISNDINGIEYTTINTCHKPHRKQDNEWYVDGMYSNQCKKIILTTDQDLIKDGVQTIDDEFLQWFVKNPSCEYVEVEVDLSKHNGQFQTKYGWKIIIPKEEPKQEWSKSTGDLAVDYAIGQSKAIQKCMHLAAEMAYRSLPKQETLEEFAERLCPNKQVEYDMIIEGAKWQQERSYSEEEVRKAIQKTITLMRYKATEFREHENTIIEQFKKK
jgi:hypothetical protein